MQLLANIKDISKFALPMAVTRLVNAANIFIGMLMIAVLGNDALAAGALITSAYTAILLVAMGVLFSVSIMLSGAHARNDNLLMGKWVKNGIILAFLVSVIAAFCMLNVANIFIFFDQKPHISELVRQYMFYAAFGLFPCLALVVLNQFLIVLGRFGFALLSTFATIPLNLTLGYVLLFGKFGFPQWGISGVAVAIALNFWIVFISLTLYLFCSKTYAKYHFFREPLKFEMSYVLQLISLGWPISIQFGVELFAFAAAAILFGWISADALAAQQVVIQCTVIAGIIPFGIAQACSMLISRRAATTKESLRDVWYTGLILVLGINLIVAVCYLVFPQQLANLYVHQATLAGSATSSIVITLLSIGAFGQIIDSIRNITASALSGLRDTKYSMLAAMLSCWIIALPVAYILAFQFNLGPIGIPLGFVCGFIVGCILLIKRFLHMSSKHGVSNADIAIEEANLAPSLE